VDFSMLRRILPVAVLLAGLVLFWALGISRYFTFDTLSHHHAELTAWVAAHGVLAALAFMLAYALVVAFSLPIAVLITPLGGFLFGPWLGAALAVIGATVGAVAVFLAARTALRDVFRARAGKTLAKLEVGFKRDAFNYLLFLRLVPVFPFWLVNIVPALLGMNLGAYALGTLIGIIPGAVVYASIGAGFAMLFERGEIPDLGVIFEWRILLPLLGLAVLSLAPIVYTRFKGPQRGGTT
jgi:uncharacterized membrane protein YdjX (TVP38/TMEM64 family)